MSEIWVFGYGSIIWKPDFAHLDARPARVHGFVRRFWQGSHDHRGVPDAPGRVVTLVADAGGWCDGMAYRVDAETAHEVFEGLDYREKNGYQRIDVALEFRAGGRSDGVVYVAPTDNHAYLGPDSPARMAAQIRVSAGPSGPNIDYLLELARALRALGIDDPHVFELERLVRG